MKAAGLKPHYNRVITGFLFLALGGCASTHAPLATVSAPVTASGTVNIGAGKVQLEPVVTTIIRKCAPPAEYLADPGPLPQIPERDLTLEDATRAWLTDRSRYRSARVGHLALSKWLKTYCQQ